MINENQFQRFASPNERHFIIRQDLGIYNAVVVGAVYEFPEKTLVNSPNTFFRPLQQCMEAIPHLGVVVKDAHTEKSYFERLSFINLEDHISIIAKSFPEDDVTAIQNELGPIMDTPFRSGIPHWRIVVSPFTASRCFIVFAFSHGIGDGITGVSFHRTFLKACQSSSFVDVLEDAIFPVPKNPMPSPFDTKERLPVSWPYLLMPLVKHLLPSFLANLLGLQATVSTADANCWVGSPTTNYHEGVRTKLRVFEIEANVLKKVLSMARQHDAKLTGTIHLLIVRALSKAIQDPNITNFTVQTPVSLRKAVGMTDDDCGNNGSACYSTYPRADADAPFSEKDWGVARSATRYLAECASRLHDHPTALLRYVKSIRGWIVSNLGKRRDCSFGLSNVGCFDASAPDVGGGATVQTKLVKMVFSHPGLISGSPLCFNLASVKGATLICTVSWLGGGLGIPESKEDSFVDGICRTVTDEFERLAFDKS